MKLCELISLNWKESLTFKQHICGEEEYTRIERKGRGHIAQPWGMQETFVHGKTDFKLNFRKEIHVEIQRGFI